MLYCPFNSSVILLNVTQDSLKLTGENIDFSLSAEEDVICETKQGEGEFKLNGKWLHEILQKVKTTTVEVSFSDKHPVVFFNPVETEEDYLFAISKVG